MDIVNKDVNHQADVQNLIVSAILRQCDAFTEEDIYQLVEKGLEQSDFAKDGVRRKEIDVTKMVDYTLHSLFIEGGIEYDHEQKKYKLYPGCSDHFLKREYYIF